ncbi:MAG: carbohydrate kinase, partial [Gammaproteobacteria bacterium]|nr:carbohydrate kinase [Gammaproteobacteria bacterium]
DTVGAGDAFQASLLAGLSEVSFAVNALSTEALRGMLETAAQAGAITCSRQGAEMPSRADLRQ